MQYVFVGSMYVGKNSSQAANVLAAAESGQRVRCSGLRKDKNTTSANRSR
jgi:hypothetical protein